MPLVKFTKENKEIEVPEGANLRNEAIKAGINTHQGFNGFGAALNSYVNCHGLGQCGTCRVRITKGMEHASPMGFIEKIRFYNPLPDPLPCMAYIGNEDYDAPRLPNARLWRHGSRNRPAARISSATTSSAESSFSCQRQPVRTIPTATDL